jgi:hypothetical protein
MSGKREVGWGFWDRSLRPEERERFRDSEPRPIRVLASKDIPVVLEFDWECVFCDMRIAGTQKKGDTPECPRCRRDCSPVTPYPFQTLIHTI